MVALYANDKQAKESLNHLCQTVNHPSRWIPSAGVHLFKEMVASWRAAPSWRAFTAEWQGIDVELDEYVQARFDDESGKLCLSLGRNSDLPHGHKTNATALALFAKLITNPQHKKFGGPCPKCGAFFVKRQQRKRYCSRKCHSADTAKAATAKRNKEIHKKKIEFANAARDAYARRRHPAHRDGGYWKRKVAQEATALMRTHPLTRGSRITATFITVNKITPPKGEK